jgi:hypothetical protein
MPCSASFVFEHVDHQLVTVGMDFIVGEKDAQVECYHDAHEAQDQRAIPCCEDKPVCVRDTVPLYRPSNNRSQQRPLEASMLKIARHTSNVQGEGATYNEANIGIFRSLNPLPVFDIFIPILSCL